MILILTKLLFQAPGDYVHTHTRTHVIYNQDMNTHMNSQSVYCSIVGQC